MFCTTIVFLTSDLIILITIIYLECAGKVFRKGKKYEMFTPPFLICLAIMIFFAFASLCGAVAISCLTYRWFRLKYCDSKKL